jgi:hypothetical protein
MLISNLACLAVAVFTAVFLCGSYETAYNPIPYREISHRRERREYLKFFLGALCELCGEMLCFLFDQTGRFGSH